MQRPSVLHRFKFSRLLTCQMALSILLACGESAKFGGASAPGALDADGKPLGYRSLTWYFQCEANPFDVPAPADATLDAVVVGGGDHGLPKVRMRDTELTFKGRLCPAESLKRDVVLVIDTSFSMSSNDPRALDQCGRMAAAKALLTGLPPDSRFGLVTFNSGLATYSTGLYSNQDQLFRDLSKNRSLADALCATEGGTNYDAALTQAGAILAKGRATATKEIYFVSDGQPDPGRDGVAVGKSLKSDGVKVGDKAIRATIATVMLAGEDTVLESQIASLDPEGKPLHAFAADTSVLTTLLTSLSANEIVGAQLKIRPIGSEEYQTYDVLNGTDGLDFVVPSITIDGEKSSQGFEVEYSFRDKRGSEFATGGKLTWQESGNGAQPTGVKLTGP